MAATRSILILPIIALIAIAVIAAFIAAVVVLIVLLVRRSNRQTAASAPEPPKRPLSEILREHRTRAGMTQEYVAEALGISRQAVSKWEAGASEPTAANLAALAALYGVPEGELMRSR
ncbi:MAG: helix-turn-helix transcriptional regulator [Clostridia bacterium]|nr:helix-turn-helix transcriptional regulator [Clostridia bacterium]